jgi:hypothetical protein
VRLQYLVVLSTKETSTANLDGLAKVLRKVVEEPIEL